MNKILSASPGMQGGAALAITLILLLVATLVGITGLNAGLMQERMSSNLNNKAVSFMAAEAGGAELLAWIEENGWPDDDNQPPYSGFVTADQVGQYLLALRPGSTWSDPEVALRIEGRAISGGNVLARTNLDLNLTNSGDGMMFDAPAPISCFGGRCSIDAGSSAKISGYDHPIPPLDCTGRGNCVTSGAGPIAPPVFFDEQQNVGNLSGGNPAKPAYEGRDRDGNSVSGRDNSVALWGDIFGPEGDDSWTVPDLPSIFGGMDPADLVTNVRDKNGSSVSPELAMSGNDTLQGLLVVGENQTFSMSGTPLFVGLIFVKDCGRVNMGGTAFVYGAIVVDASGCDNNYSPFASNGTPDVRYSKAALSGDGPGVGTGPGYAVTGWRESL